LYVALIVGTVLNVINQGNALLGLASINRLKLILTYCVPYVVCTYGAVSYRLKKADVTLERSATKETLMSPEFDNAFQPRSSSCGSFLALFCCSGASRS